MSPTRGFDAARIPRRTPDIQKAIEVLQAADDCLRAGNKSGAYRGLLNAEEIIGDVLSQLNAPAERAKEAPR